MYLTKKKIIDLLQKHPALKGAEIDWDEPGRAIIILRDGLTWCANDGNRSTEGFIFHSYDDCEPRDTVGYLRERLAAVEPVRPSKQ